MHFHNRVTIGNGACCPPGIGIRSDKVSFYSPRSIPLPPTPDTPRQKPTMILFALHLYQVI